MGGTSSLVIKVVGICIMELQAGCHHVRDAGAFALDQLSHCCACIERCSELDLQLARAFEQKIALYNLAIALCFVRCSSGVSLFKHAVSRHS
jgi:hypothetical protein